MKPSVILSISLLCLFVISPASALVTNSADSPSLGTAAVNPSLIEVGTPTSVRISIEITDPELVPRTVFLERVRPIRDRRARLDRHIEKLTSLHELLRSGAPEGFITDLKNELAATTHDIFRTTRVRRLRDDGRGADEIAGDSIFTTSIRLFERHVTALQFQISALFRITSSKLGIPLDRRVSEPIIIPVGRMLSPGEGGIVEGPGGISLTVPSNAIDYEVIISLFPAVTTSILASPGNLPVEEAISVVYEPTALSSGDFSPPAEPLAISIPVSETLTSTDFIVAEQILLDSIAGSSPGLVHQFVPVATALANGDTINTESGVFSGIRGGGLFVFLGDTGSGFATGTVSDASGPRPGVVVSNDTNTLVSVTNSAGQYSLFISGGPFTVTGFDPFRGSGGSAAGNIVTDGSTVTANISLTAPATSPPITRDGIRNGGFERGNLTSWVVAGAGQARQELVSTGTTINPTEGQWMADINTGPGSVGGTGSSLMQRFRVPAGVNTLRLDFNFVSEEFPEFVGTVFNDAFRAVVTTPNGETTFAEVSVNQSGGFTLIGDCGFPGGDSTCGQTGWREAAVDLSAFAGTGDMIEVELLFSAVDAGDNIFDTHILVDNIRFSTLWIDVKIVSGASANVARVRQEVRDANEVISQAGINIRLRPALSVTITDPGGLLDTDATWTTECRPVGSPACITKGVPTSEEDQLLSLARSGIATDLNVYYVRSLTGVGALAIAIGPDDFHDINILNNSGVIMTDTVFPETLAHEAGHLLISPDRAGSALEHNVGTANNIMNTPRTVPRNLIGRVQSENINRAGAPLLQP